MGINCILKRLKDLTRPSLSFVYFFLFAFVFPFFFQQAGDTSFNRGMLLNIGFKEALKFNNYKCFIFHDVDLMPENDRNKYSCPSSPRHLSVAVDKFNYLQVYRRISVYISLYKRFSF